MPKFDPDDYLPVASYKEAAEVFHMLVPLVLFEFARHGGAKRNLIIRRFLARTNMMVRGVFALWDIQDYQDCWILYRCLLDRLFHLHHLASQDEFEIFDDWSFLEQFKAINRVRSDPEFRGALNSKWLRLTDEHKERAKRLVENPPEWKRPNAEDVSRDLDMHFLYKFGYDYGSTHVHPMANDGERDFFTITQLEPRDSFPDERAVLSNTLLTGTMTVQAGLNASTYSWRALLWNVLDDLRKFLDSGQDNYKQTFAKLGMMVVQQAPLSQSRNTSE